MNFILSAIGGILIFKICEQIIYSGMPEAELSLSFGLLIIIGHFVGRLMGFYEGVAYEINHMERRADGSGSRSLGCSEKE